MTSRSGERGDTLIESLAATVIIGIGVTGLLAALGTGVSLASVQRDRTVAEVALRTFAENVRGAAPAPTCSAAPAAYTSVAPTVSGLTMSAGPVTCTSDDLLHQVTLTVTSSDPRVGTSTLEIAKRGKP